MKARSESSQQVNALERMLQRREAMVSRLAALNLEIANQRRFIVNLVNGVEQMPLEPLP